jgi:hypothetical protein
MLGGENNRHTALLLLPRRLGRRLCGRLAGCARGVGTGNGEHLALHAHPLVPKIVVHLEMSRRGEHRSSDHRSALRLYVLLELVQEQEIEEESPSTYLLNLELALRRECLLLRIRWIRGLEVILKPFLEAAPSVRL